MMKLDFLKESKLFKQRLNTFNQQNMILRQMTDLYLSYCLPEVIITDSKVELDYKWRNAEAENAYNKLLELLQFTQTKHS